MADFDLLEPAIYVLAALTIFTALQRVLHVRRQLARGDRAPCNDKPSLGRGRFLAAAGG